MIFLVKRNAGVGADNVIVLNPNTVGDWLGPGSACGDCIHPHWKSVKPLAHKADYLRASLLYSYGGLWFDVGLCL